jgi:hypothetical protein
MVLRAQIPTGLPFFWPSRSIDLENFFVIRRIVKPSCENPCFFYLILIGNVPNKLFLSLSVDFGQDRNSNKSP